MKTVQEDPEWLPEELLNDGLRVAADPPAAGARTAAIGTTPPQAPAKQPELANRDRDHRPTAAPPHAPPPPLEHLERLVGERIVAAESRIESKLSSTVDDTREIWRRSATAGTGSRRFAPGAPAKGDGRDGLRIREIESRLRDAERRVTRAVAATSRNAAEVRRIFRRGAASG